MHIDVANESSTSESLGIPFIIEFTDESGYNGTFYKDTVTIGGSTLENVQFGVTIETAGLVDDPGFTGIGIIGVGFESNEATKVHDNYEYPNIITELYNNGLIGAKAFSLYLNGKGSTSSASNTAIESADSLQTPRAEVSYSVASIPRYTMDLYLAPL